MQNNTFVILTYIHYQIAALKVMFLKCCVYGGFCSLLRINRSYCMLYMLQQQIGLVLNIYDVKFLRLLS